MKFRKLILSSVTSLFLISTLATSTYAYVIIGNKADIRDFNFNIENTTGLLLSLDGKNFSQDISSNMLEEKISEGVNIDYTDLRFTGVTPKSNDGNVSFNDNNEIEFVKDISDKEHQFNTIAEKNIDYISFDLWFRALNSSEKKDFDLFITNNSYIKGEKQEVILNNKLKTLKKDYNSGDTITLNTQNAMRIAISLIEQDDNKETTSNTNYYEIIDENDLGSSAVEDLDKFEEEEKLRHNKDVNAMYTYYNNCFPLYPFEKASEYNESFNTLNSFEDKILSQFKYNESSNEYNDIHTKIYIYLEGWDSDYFLGLPTSCNTLNIKLQFEIKEAN